MKFTAFLLAVFIMFLSVKSVAEPITVLKEVDVCCKKDKTSAATHHEEETENSCDELCSPFQACCPYVTFSPNFFSFNVPNDYPLVNGKLPLYRVSSYSSYLADFWQPPKLV